MKGIGRRWRKGGRKRKKETDLILERGHLSHRVVPSDERLRRYERALLMAVYSLHLSLQQLSPEYLQENRDTWEPLLGERRVWKLARHQNPFVSHFPLSSLPPPPHLFFLSFSLPLKLTLLHVVCFSLFSLPPPLPPSSSSPSPSLLPLPPSCPLPECASISLHSLDPRPQHRSLSVLHTSVLYWKRYAHQMRSGDETTHCIVCPIIKAY